MTPAVLREKMEVASEESDEGAGDEFANGMGWGGNTERTTVGTAGSFEHTCLTSSTWLPRSAPESNHILRSKPQSKRNMNKRDPDVTKTSCLRNIPPSGGEQLRSTSGRFNSSKEKYDAQFAWNIYL